MLGAIRGLFQKINRSSGSGGVQDKARRVQDIYRSLDREMTAFKAASGLKCPTPCGECCFNSAVEASELEMLPMAVDFVRSGKADEWYRLAEGRNFEGRCVFYSSDDGHGQCLSYVFRPLVCRLFGYAGNKDKHGQPRMVTCGVLKRDRPMEVERVLGRVQRGKLHPPMMADHVMRVAALDPSMSRDSIPINRAFKTAVERVILSQKFSMKEQFLWRLIK